MVWRLKETEICGFTTLATLNNSFAVSDKNGMAELAPIPRGAASSRFVGRVLYDERAQLPT
mgnify:CR=1 FL=1